MSSYLIKFSVLFYSKELCFSRWKTLGKSILELVKTVTSLFIVSIKNSRLLYHWDRFFFQRSETSNSVSSRSLFLLLFISPRAFDSWLLIELGSRYWVKEIISDFIVLHSNLANLTGSYQLHDLHGFMNGPALLRYDLWYFQNPKLKQQFLMYIGPKL